LQPALACGARASRVNSLATLIRYLKIDRIAPNVRVDRVCVALRCVREFVDVCIARALVRMNTYANLWHLERPRLLSLLARSILSSAASNKGQGMGA